MSEAFDQRKFDELVVYVAEHSADDPRFVATKLNKLLYFADFKAFAITGASITGASYVRMDRGPVPEQMLPALDRLESEGAVERTERTERTYFNYRQKVVRALRPSMVHELLTEPELEIVDAVLAELRLLNASEVSELSHLDRGWQLAADREAIPYEAAYLSDRRPSARELAMRDEARRERRSGR